MQSFGNLVDQANRVQPILASMNSAEQYGIRFRNAGGLRDTARIVQDGCNASLDFYGPSNSVGSKGFRWFGGSSNLLGTLNSNGDFTVIGDVIGINTALSDSNYKADVAPYDAWRAPLDGLRPVTFVWRDNAPVESKRGTADIGLLAQDVAAAYPLAHATLPVGQVVLVDKLVPLLVAAVKAQVAAGDDVAARVSALEARVAGL